MSGFRRARVNLGADFPELDALALHAVGNKVRDFRDFRDSWTRAHVERGPLRPGNYTRTRGCAITCRV